MENAQLTVFYGRIKMGGIITTRAHDIKEARILLHKRNEEVNEKRVHLYGAERRELMGISENLNSLFPETIKIKDYEKK